MIKKSLISSLLLIVCLGMIIGCGGAEPTVIPAPTTAPTTIAAPALPTVEGTSRFAIVSEESTASYIVTEEFFAGALAKLGIDAGIQQVTGSTQAVSGELRLLLDEGKSEFVSGQFTVDISTLATTRSQRDDWIRDNALESSKFPIAVFTASAVEGAPASYNEGEEVSFQLSGDLLVRDITQPVTFDVTATLEGDILRAVATTTMRIRDFGFEPPSFANTLTVADEFEIRVEIVATAQEAACGCDTSLGYVGIAAAA